MTGVSAWPAVVATLAGGLAVWLTWPATSVVRRPSSRQAGLLLVLALLVTGAAGVPEVLAGPARLVGRWLGPVLLGALVAGAAFWMRRRSARRRQVTRRGAAVLELCEDLAGDLEAGAAPAVALQRAAARWPELGAPATAHALGGSVPAAWRDLAARPGAGDLHVVAAAWEVAQRSGAGLAEALTAVASGLQEQQRTRRLVDSELASARATARLMAVLPVLTLAIGSGAGDPVGFLLGTPAGLACAAVGGLLAFAGVAWIEAIAGALEKETSWQPPEREASR